MLYVLNWTIKTLRPNNLRFIDLLNRQNGYLAFQGLLMYWLKSFTFNDQPCYLIDSRSGNYYYKTNVWLHFSFSLQYKYYCKYISTAEISSARYLV